MYQSKIKSTIYVLEEASLLQHWKCHPHRVYRKERRIGFYVRGKELLIQHHRQHDVWNQNKLSACTSSIDESIDEVLEGMTIAFI